MASGRRAFLKICHLWLTNASFLVFGGWPASLLLPLFLPSLVLFKFLLFLVPLSYSLLEWPKRGAPDAARGVGVRPPRPGPPWVPEAEAATPEAGPGSPAPRPARPNLRRATGRPGWEKRGTDGKTLKAGLSRVTEADGRRRKGRAKVGRIPDYERGASRDWLRLLAQALAPLWTTTRPQLH